MDIIILDERPTNTSIPMSVMYLFHTILKRAYEKDRIYKINGVSLFISDLGIVYYWVIHSVSVS